MRFQFSVEDFSYLYLLINVLKSFKSLEIYSVLNPIIEVCQRIECFWRTVILFWNISICSSWKEASKDQRGSYRKSSWDDVSLEKKYILLKNVVLRSTICSCSKSILMWLFIDVYYHLEYVVSFNTEWLWWIDY